MKKLLAAVLTISATLAVSPAWSANPALDKLARALEGSWSGRLEYRDYRSNERVQIPHARTVSVAPDASYVMTSLEFTDPTYKVNVQS